MFLPVVKIISEQITSHHGKIVPCVKTHRMADRIAVSLAKAYLPVTFFNGGKLHAVCTRTLKLFRVKSNTIVGAACIIHVGNTLLVAHVDAQTDHRFYLHRSVRTACASKAAVGAKT